MSTFDGLVDEFPDIRIDYFRKHVGTREPAACFLSHVHSDHLLGLETLRMPFVYCSAVTRSILLRMEKYPHRINFQKGILESRRKTYRHLKLILRSLPLETPIDLELRPRLTIRVTLFDANHCPGAVMFLIEGDGKAILYTGDIRAEPWWVNSIVRNPILLPYMYGHQHLDCVYLDTTFASHEDIYNNFPTKAEGLQELLAKIDKCADETIFYFRAWTLGYEDVWLTLANFLRGHVHVDDYQLGLYASIAENGSKQSTPLTGFQVGNSIHPGCLSSDSNAIIHSCEPGMECHAQLKKASNVVWIIPIISRAPDGTELLEMGAGGGFGDLQQVAPLENMDDTLLQTLRTFCTLMFSGDCQSQQVEAIIEAVIDAGTVHCPLDGLGLNQEEEIKLKDFLSLLVRRHSLPGLSHAASGNVTSSPQKILHFPYSRHSSLTELRDLISRLHPKDMCPCTVNLESWSEEFSMEALFGDLCTEKTFRYDTATRASAVPPRTHRDSSGPSRKRKRLSYDSQETASQDSQQLNDGRISGNTNPEPGSKAFQAHQQFGEQAVIVIDDDNIEDVDDVAKLGADEVSLRGSVDVASDISLSQEAFNSQESPERINTDMNGSDRRARLMTRQHAYRAAKACLLDGDEVGWDNLHLRSLGWQGHTKEEPIL